jgi:hypothetical protein
VTSFVTIGLYFLRKRNGTGQNILLIYLLYTQVSNFIVNPTLFKFTNNNIWGFRLFTIIEYTLFTYFLYSILTTRILKRILLFLSFSFYGICIYDGLNSKSSTFDSLPSGYSAILLIFFSLFSLYELLRSTDYSFLYERTKFWFTTGYIIYFSGTFFIFISAQGNFENPVYFSLFQSLNDFFTIVRNIMFGLAFVINPNKK